MTSERWQRLKTVLDGALGKALAERPDFLEEACAGDEALKSEVEELLCLEDASTRFLEEPLFGAPVPEGELPDGGRVGPYRIVGEIGRGGMGRVYCAIRADAEYEKEVAVKIVATVGAHELSRRFRAERQILAHLDHPNIAKLLDGGTTEDGRPFFVMDYVRGLPVDSFCTERKLSIPQRLRLFQTVCSAVHFAHQNLVVHRDLKPGNILVTAEGVPMLLDFGIAKLLDPGVAPPSTTELGLRPMTLESASPEQVRGDPITTASDVYSLGILLYRLLTDRSPYRASPEDHRAFERAVCDEQPERPSVAAFGRDAGRRLAGDLDTIVLKAIHKEPSRRYTSADELSADIERYLAGHPVAACGDSPAYRAGKFARRHRVGVSVAAAVILLVLGFAATVTVLLARAEQERDRAEAVSAFLEELFQEPDPSRARGETVTAREVLDRGRAKMTSELDSEPQTKAALLETMGRVYRRLGLLEEAQSLLRSALKLQKSSAGLERATTLINLGLVELERGKAAEAEPLLREGIAILRRSRETESPDYAGALNNLAALAEHRSHYSEAEALYREALALKRKVVGNSSEEVALGLNNLAGALLAQGKAAPAEGLYREALALRRRLYGPKPHPEVATSLNNLASLLEDRGERTEAETLYREALSMRRKLYGARHPRVAQSLNNLAFLLLAESRPEDAEPLSREALSIADESLPETHLNRGIFRRNLAAVLAAQGRGREGEALTHEALRIFRAAEAPRWRIADVESVLGSCLAAQGRLEEAEPLLVKSHAVLEEDPGAAAYARQAQKRLEELHRLIAGGSES